MDDPLAFENVKKQGRVIRENNHAFSMIARWPLHEGHVMVLPKRRVDDICELSPEESHDFLQMVFKMRTLLDEVFEDGTIVIQNPVVRRTEPQHLHFQLFPFGFATRQIYFVRPQMVLENIEKIEVPMDELARRAKALGEGKKP